MCGVYNAVGECFGPQCWFLMSVLSLGGGHFPLPSAPEVDLVRKKGPGSRGLVALVEGITLQQERPPQQVHLEPYQQEGRVHMLVRLELLWA